MNIKEAKKWLNAFKKSKFKCIAPNQVFEAMKVMRIVKIKKRGDK